MGRLDDFAVKSGQATGQPVAPVRNAIPADDSATYDAAVRKEAELKASVKLALRSITISGIIVFLFKVTVAAVVVGLPFAILYVLVSSLK